MKPIETCPTCDGIGVPDIKLKGITLPLLIKRHTLLQKGCIYGEKKQIFLFFSKVNLIVAYNAFIL